jgi:hypothetical protein
VKINSLHIIFICMVFSLHASAMNNLDKPLQSVFIAAPRAKSLTRALEKKKVNKDFIEKSEIIPNLLKAFKDLNTENLGWIIAQECERSFNNYEKHLLETKKPQQVCVEMKDARVIVYTVVEEIIFGHAKVLNEFKSSQPQSARL